MTITRRTGLIVGMMLTLVIVSGCASSAGAGAVPTIGMQVDQIVPSSVLQSPLLDQRGQRTSLAAYKGKLLVLADAMTLCQEVCPLLGANLVQMARETSSAGQANQVVFIQLTVDPDRDSPARLAAYRHFFDPTPSNWVTLIGSAGSIKAIWDFFGIAYAKVAEDSPPAVDWWTGKPLTYDVQHSDIVLFLDPQQRERYLIDGTPDTQGKALPKPLNSFLSAEGRTNLDQPDPGDSWTVPQGLRVVSWLTGTKLKY